jgi:glycosyltransferase involved in cell wall biosynthesis
MASAPNKQPRVALVHDWVYGGGAEKVLEQLHKIYPDAPIYTSYCTDEWRQRLDYKVVTGYLQHWPFSSLRKFLPLLRQWWFARLSLANYDLVISTTGNGEAKFVRVRDDATHICYCHTPPHFYWRKYKEYLANPGFGKFNFLARLGLVLLVKPLRKRDYQAAQKVDYFIGNSNHIVADIKKYYDRDAVAIFPPVDIAKFASVKRTKSSSPRFITWGRHVPDKRLDLAVKACTNLGYELKVIGKGPETESLRKLAGPTVSFPGFAWEEDLLRHISGSDAFIFPSMEDFGIAPVEAMVSGMPVVAYRAGGALDYVIEGKTGTFFTEQTVESLQSSLKEFDPNHYDSAHIKKFAKKFSNDEFAKAISAFVSSLPPKER